MLSKSEANELFREQAFNELRSQWSWHAYPSIYAMGHAALAELLLDPVLVEEKIDGSQFSFGVFEDPEHGRLVKTRSKGAQLIPEAPEKMFKPACDWVLANQDRLRVGYTYRGEVLCKPKHNVLAYERTPKNGIILFDINPGAEEYASYEAKAEEASRLGLEVVPMLHQGLVSSIDQFRAFLDQESVLGGQKIEGVVIKNYLRFGRDKKVLMGKFVSEAFKETHARVWKTENPTQGDVIQTLIERYMSFARYEKALIHLRERGLIEDSPRDIGLLMKEVWPDIEKECKEEIMEALYKWAGDKVRRGVTSGIPTWYKDRLLKMQFEHDAQEKAA